MVLWRPRNVLKRHFPNGDHYSASRDTGQTCGEHRAITNFQALSIIMWVEQIFDRLFSFIGKFVMAACWVPIDSIFRAPLGRLWEVKRGNSLGERLPSEDIQALVTKLKSTSSRHRTMMRHLPHLPVLVSRIGSCDCSHIQLKFLECRGGNGKSWIIPIINSRIVP